MVRALPVESGSREPLTSDPQIPVESGSRNASLAGSPQVKLQLVCKVANDKSGDLKVMKRW